MVKTPRKPPKNKKEAEQDVLATMGEDEPMPNEKRDQTPLFQVIGGAQIRVSKAFGRTIERKKQAVLTANEMYRTAWDEAYRYYNHNQVKDTVFRSNPQRNIFRTGDSFENIVFANTSVMIPAIYSKNPDVEFSTDQDEDKPFVSALTKAVNAVFNKKPPFGFNLKPRMKKAALHAELTNLGIVKLDYIEKEDSAEAANAEMEELFDQLEKAKDQNEVKELEGKMKALESNVEWAEPGGFRLATVIPTNIYIDPAAENEDGSDASWLLEECYIDTEYLNAKFTKKDKDGRTLLYKPTHRVKADGSGAREDALGLVLEAIEEGNDPKTAHSTAQRQSYLYQNMTKSFYYWDKSSRRLYLFVDNDWTWPIGAWNDPLGISRFFPYFFVQFYPSTGGMVGVGEVSYYLDQQDEINTINKEIVRIRRIIFNVVVYNNNKVKPDDARKLASYLRTGTGEDNILGINIDAGMSIKDAMETLSPPSLNFDAAFNKQPIYQTIDRISSVSDALRGQQFKTNTVQDAVQAYKDAANIRVGNRTDAIEDCVADLAWAVAELLVTKCEPEYIKGLIGDIAFRDWKPCSIRELNTKYTVKVAAGSTEKPTSQQKKKESIEIVQSVGQFARAAPGATLRIILKLLQKAFPNLEITEEDWAAIGQEVQAQMTKGVSTGGGGAGAAASPAGANGAGAENPQESAVMQQLQSLPPEEKIKIMEQIKSGTPPQQALAPYIRGNQNG